LDRKLGKYMVIRSVRRGTRKWRAKTPEGEGKWPKKRFQNFFKNVDRSSFTTTCTLDRVVKSFSTNVKKEVRNEVETLD